MHVPILPFYMYIIVFFSFRTYLLKSKLNHFPLWIPLLNFLFKKIKKRHHNCGVRCWIGKFKYWTLWVDKRYIFSCFVIILHMIFLYKAISLHVDVMALKFLWFLWVSKVVCNVLRAHSLDHLQEYDRTICKLQWWWWIWLC